jgi:hypothetical protein
MNGDFRSWRIEARWFRISPKVVIAAIGGSWSEQSRRIRMILI